MTEVSSLYDHYIDESVVMEVKEGVLRYQVPHSTLVDEIVIGDGPQAIVRVRAKDILEQRLGPLVHDFAISANSVLDSSDFAHHFGRFIGIVGNTIYHSQELREYVEVLFGDIVDKTGNLTGSLLNCLNAHNQDRRKLVQGYITAVRKKRFSFFNELLHGNIMVMWYSEKDRQRAGLLYLNSEAKKVSDSVFAFPLH